MSKVECPNCAMEIDAKEKHCPICGNKMEVHNKWIQWVAIVLAVIFILTLIF